jgi:hypothetical protein
MMIAIFFWWIGLSIVVAVAANTRGPRPDRVVPFTPSSFRLCSAACCCWRWHRLLRAR